MSKGRTAIGNLSQFQLRWGRFLPEHTTAVSLLDNRSKHGFSRPRRRRMTACQQVSAC